MSVSLKKFDLLIRENSKATQQEVHDYLIRVFNSIEKNNTENNKKLGFANVFDARTSEYYLYYSDNAKDFFNMTKNKYQLVPKGIVTISNFLDVFKKNLGKIKNMIMPKIVTEKLIIDKNGKATLSQKALGDLPFDTVEVKRDSYYEDFIVRLENSQTIIGLNPEDAGKTILVTYLS